MVRHNEFRFTNTELGLVTSPSRMETATFGVEQLYRLQEGCITVVTNDSTRALINLIEYVFLPDYISLIAPDSIVQIIEVSRDFDTHMMTTDLSFLPISGREEFFTYSLQQKKNLLFPLSTEEQIQIENPMTTMRSVLQGPVFRKEVIQYLLVGLLHNTEYITRGKRQTELGPLTRQNDIFQRFTSLVDTYSGTERNISFYAGKLCLAPHYLNTVIRQTNQRTVIDRIDQSIILEAKVLLEHSNRLIYQISDELDSPNPFFLSKSFKRMTGVTPQEYRKN